MFCENPFTWKNYMEDLVVGYDNDDNSDIDGKCSIKVGGAHEHDFIHAAASASEKQIDQKRIIRCSTCNSVFCEICGKLLQRYRCYCKYYN
jgi:hypothetical protein